MLERGDTASIEISCFIINEVASIPPKVTLVTLDKLLPPIPTTVPPEPGPLLGKIAVTFGRPPEELLELEEDEEGRLQGTEGLYSII